MAIRTNSGEVVYDHIFVVERERRVVGTVYDDGRAEHRSGLDVAGAAGLYLDHWGRLVRRPVEEGEEDMESGEGPRAGFAGHAGRDVWCV